VKKRDAQYDEDVELPIRANEVLRLNSLMLLKDANLMNMIKEERKRERDISIERAYQEILHHLEKPLSYVHHGISHS
jgi:hypothetical protein